MNPIDTVQGISRGSSSYAQKYGSVTDNEIRVLLLQPAVRGEVICHMSKIALTEKVMAYSALSYTWGTSGLTDSIMVQGHPFAVTQNLKAALVQLSQLPCFEPLVLWVDAICINQADDTEKTHQLKLMGSIYQKARETIVWLGNEAAHSGSAMRSLKLLSRFASDTDFFWVNWRQFPKDENEANTVRNMIDCLQFGLEASSQVPLLSLESLFKRSWWERVWTLQEVALAQSVHYVCGSECLRWDELDAAVFILFLKHETLLSLEHRESLRSILHTLFNRQDFRRKLHELGNVGPTLPLAEAVDMAFENSLQCSDHRDYIYGMLGMANDTASELVHIDYATETVSSVYIQVAKLFLKQYGLRLLHYC